LRGRYYRPEKGWLVFLLRVFTANAGMAAGLYFSVYQQRGLWLHWAALDRAVNLAISIGAAALLYFLLLGLLGLRFRHISGEQRGVGKV